MSSILKALEKVEQERNAQHEGPLGRFHKERERRKVWVVPACVLSGAAAAALITFAAMGGFSGGEKVPAKAAVAQAPQPLPAPAPAPAPVAVEVAVPTVVQEGRPAAKGGPEAEVPALRPGRSAREAAPLAGARQGEAEVRRPSQSAAGRVPSTPAVAPAVAHTPEAPPTPEPAPAAQGATWVAPTPIRVTGIAWQKDAGSSVAMVNGRQVYEGETVEGSRVKEILPDRVRFLSASGGTFDVPLGAGQ